MKKIFNILMTAAVICTSMFVSSCGKEKAGDSAIKDLSETDRTLYLFNWTYYTPDSVIEKFENEFNCKVVVATFDSNEVMYSKLKAGATGYDFTFPSQDYTSIMIDEGMLLPIDHSRFTNKSKINPKVLAKATYDSEMKYSVPYYMGGGCRNCSKQTACKRLRKELEHIHTHRLARPHVNDG